MLQLPDWFPRSPQKNQASESNMDSPKQEKQSPNKLVSPQLCSGWWFGTCFLMNFHILGMSSSQLTFIFFRGVGLNHQPVLLNAIHFWVVQCGSVQWFQKITRKINGLVEWVLIIPNYCTMFEDSPGFPISVAQIPRLVYHRINPDGALWFSCSLQRSKSHRMQTYVYIEIHIHQCVWDGWREFAYSWWHPHDFLKPP